MSSKKIKIGIFGAGKMAEWHLKAYHSNPNVKVIGICNPNSNKGLKLAKKFNIPNVFKNEEDLLSLDLEGIDISAPTGVHKDLICKSIEKGLHVYTEKPLCCNLKEANEIVKLNKKYNKIIFVGYNLRFCKEFQEIKKIIDSNELGDINFILMIRGTILDPNSYMFTKLNAGIIAEFSSHFIDLLRWWGKKDISQVYVEGSNVFDNYPKPDSVCLNLKFKDNSSAVIINTYALPGLVPEIRIFGSRKNLILKYGKISIQTLPKKWSVYSLLWITLNEAINLPYKFLYNPVKGACDHYIDCIQKNKISPLDENEGKEIIRLAEILNRSYLQKKVISLD